MNRLRCACAPLFAAFGSLVSPGVGAESCEGRYMESPQFVAADCRFQNPPNPEAKAQRSSWDIWTRLLTEKKVGTVPVDPIPVRPVTRAALDQLDAASNHVIRLGHSSHLLKLRGQYWLIDPVFGPRASPVSWAGPLRFHAPPVALPDLPPIEGLILSHDHYDHLDVPTIEALRGQVKRYFVPLGVGARLRAMGVAADRIEEYDWWQEGRHGDIGLTAAPAQHFSGRTLWDRNKTLWASWVIRSGSERIFYSGDSGYFPGFKEIGEKLGPFDLAFVKVGAYGPGAPWADIHMSAEDAVKASRDVRATRMFPVHWATFNLAFHAWDEPIRRTLAAAKASQVDVVTPRIGELVDADRPFASTAWWEQVR